MAARIDKQIEQVTIWPQDNTIEIRWRKAVFEDEVEITEVFKSKTFRSAAEVDADTTIPTQLATRVKRAMGWL